MSSGLNVVKRCELASEAQAAGAYDVNSADAADLAKILKDARKEVAKKERRG